ncbi:glycosyltransferase family 4 protein [Rheinheimera sp.]|uniref:glycosyltransferase family 4 protein n=1 Tax=Rheinheimera sp. TaxID=1869214 RepID=UPI003D2AC782
MKDKDIYIVYNKFFTPDGVNRVLGGIETYLHNLAELFSNNSMRKVYIIQPATHDFEHRVGDYYVLGKKISNYSRDRFCNFVLNLARLNNGFLIFGADQFSVKTDYPYAISIMHGVSWDLPASYFTCNGGVLGIIGRLPYFGDGLAKRIFILQRLKQIQNCRNNVLVDYNSVNWYRTQFSDRLPFNYKVILNFAVEPLNYEPALERHVTNQIKIIFARRFQNYRGVDLMVGSVLEILKDVDNVSFCFAGEGPEEQKIKDTFANEPRVVVSRYDSAESVIFHQKFHIAVVPSIASEGSSLSLAEAMLAGCAVIATDVGGMTNMVIDGYNGILIQPSVTSLTQALRSLIDDQQRRQQLALRGWQSAATAFAHRRWCQQWLELIEQVGAA